MKKIFSKSGRFVSVALVLVLGIAISLGLSSWTRALAKRQMIAEFDQRAGDHVRLLMTAINNHLEVAEALANFYEGSNGVEKEEFSLFTRNFLDRHPDILDLDWIPRISASQRLDFEEGLKNSGTDDFQIKEFGPAGNFQKAAPRPEYFPVVYIEPLETNQFLVGFDEASDPTRRRTIEKARDTAMPAATPGLSLKRQTRGFGCRVFYPIYRKAVPHVTPAQRRENLLGMVSILFHVGQVIEKNIAGLNPSGIDIYLYDEATEGTPRLLAFHPARLNVRGNLSAKRKYIAGLFFRETIPVADRRWTVICRPLAAAWNYSTRWEAWAVLPVGFFITIILALYLFNLLNREAEIRATVTIRTAELRRAATEWQHTFDSITDAVFIQGNDHTIQKVNAAFAQSLKMKPEDIVGKKCFEVMHGTNCPWPTCPFEETKKDGKAHTVEINDPHIGVPLLVTTSPIFDAQGQLAGSVHISKDITELKRAETEMRKAMELKVAFTSMVSHELRTPLTAIKEGINILIDGVAGEINKEQKGFLEIAKRNVDRLARLINNVLDFQKLEAGKMEFYFLDNNLNDAVRDVCQTMRPLAEKKGLTLDLNLDENLPSVKFDKDKIIQVLTNLVNNALKFTEKGGITVSTRRDGPSVRVSVADTGPGIKPEDMPKLFQKFEQLATVNERKTGGSGLGLAISRQIIEQHLGKIWAESEPGEGTAFHFVLPAPERHT